MQVYNFEHSVFRSRKALLKLQIAEIDPLDGSEKNVGSCLFDLKEAIPCIKPLDNPDESYIMVSYVLFLMRLSQAQAAIKYWVVRIFRKNFS